MNKWILGVSAACLALSVSWAEGPDVKAADVLVFDLARSIDEETGKPVIDGRRLTGLPKTMEWSAWIATVATRGKYSRRSGRRLRKALDDRVTHTC